MKRKFVNSIIVMIACCSLVGCNNISTDDGSIQQQADYENSSEIVNITADDFSEKWINSIDEVETTFCDNQAINKDIPVNDIKMACKNLRKEIASGAITDDVTAFYRLKQIIAMTKMIHTSLYYDTDNNPFGSEFYQIDYIYSEGHLRILKLPTDLSEYLGATLVKIGNCSIEEYLNLVGTVISYETESGRNNLIYVKDVPMLRYLGIIGPDDKTIKLTVVNDDKESSFELPIETGEGKSTSSFYNYEQLPETYQLRIDCYENEMNYGYKVLEKENAIYFLYLSCMDSPKDSMNSVFEKMMKEFDDNPNLDRLIIDVRFNQGGNRSVLQGPLLRNKEALKQKKISLILGSFTASAGCQVLEDCLDYGFDVTSYGQETQGAIDNYTEIRYKKISSDGLTLGFPTVHDELPKIFEKYGKVKTGIIPDVIVENRLEDLVDGKDTTLDLILEQ